MFLITKRSSLLQKSSFFLLSLLYFEFYWIDTWKKMNCKKITSFGLVEDKENWRRKKMDRRDASKKNENWFRSVLFFWSEQRITVNGITWNKKMQILKIPTPKRCWRGFGCSNLRRTIFIVGCCRFEAPGAICFIVEICWTQKQKQQICYIFITFSQKFLY